MKPSAADPITFDCFIWDSARTQTTEICHFQCNNKSTNRKKSIKIWQHKQKKVRFEAGNHKYFITALVSVKIIISFITEIQVYHRLYCISRKLYHSKCSRVFFSPAKCHLENVHETTTTQMFHKRWQKYKNSRQFSTELHNPLKLLIKNYWIKLKWCL